MTSLYETAINGIGIGAKAEEINQMYKDHDGYPLAQAILLNLGMALDDLKRAESQAAAAARCLRTSLDSFDKNRTVDAAGWLTHYAGKVEDYTRQAQTAYTRVGEAWRLWKLQTD